MAWVEWLLRPAVGGPLLLLAVIVCLKLSEKNALPDDGPWVGLRDQRFARFRAGFRSLGTMQSMIGEGYQKFTKAGLPFFLPSTFSGGSIVLPTAYIDQVLAVKGEDRLSTKELHNRVVAPHYTLSSDSQIYSVDMHAEVIRKQLTRAIPQLTGVVAEELALAIDEFWGTDTVNWKDVCIHDTCSQIVARTSNRVFVGAPLCRNETFLSAASAFATAIFLAGPVISSFPAFLQPIVGPIIATPCRKYLAKCRRLFKPVVVERLANWDRKKREPDWKWEAPNDYLTWQIEEAEKRNLPRERDPEIMLVRVMVCNMVAIHSSTMTIANVLLSLYSTDPEKGYVEAIRQQCEQVLEEENGQWTKTSMNKMTKADSAIRESLRMEPTSHLSLPRLVKQAGGFTFEDGQHVPQGTRVAFAATSVHLDPSNYPDPLAFNPFRFSDARDALAVQIESERESSDSASSSCESTGYTGNTGKKVLAHRNHSLTTTSNAFLGFGRGAHSCPGRFFASSELKLLLAFLVMNYDIEHIKQRPQNSSLGEFNIHPMKATLRVRRRIHTTV